MNDSQEEINTSRIKSEDQTIVTHQNTKSSSNRPISDIVQG